MAPHSFSLQYQTKSQKLTRISVFQTSPQYLLIHTIKSSCSQYMGVTPFHCFITIWSVVIWFSLPEACLLFYFLLIFLSCLASSYWRLCLVWTAVRCISNSCILTSLLSCASFDEVCFLLFAWQICINSMESSCYLSANTASAMTPSGPGILHFFDNKACSISILEVWFLCSV